MLYTEFWRLPAACIALRTWSAKAERLRAAIREQSFDGDFFVDNALRKDGKLQVTRNRTEVCQYFAFSSMSPRRRRIQALADPTKDFGPRRKQTKAFPEVHPANAFVGNVLRLELLSAPD